MTQFLHYIREKVCFLQQETSDAAT